MGALETVLAALESSATAAGRAHPRQQPRGGYMASCPAHADGTPSLSVAVGKDGRVLLNCLAGCATEDVVGALNLEMSDLFVTSGRNGRTRAARPAQKTSVATAPVRYSVRNADGLLVATHVRHEAPGGRKRFVWERDGAPGLQGLRVADLPLYRTEDLAAHPGERVVVTEGEKACDALVQRGILALGTVTGAASCPAIDTLRSLLGRRVVLWPDNDEAGQQHMARVAQRLEGVATAISLVAWTEAPPKGDAADFLGSDAELLALLEDAPLWVPNASRPGAGTSGSSVAVDSSSRDRPPIFVGPDDLAAAVDQAERALTDLEVPRIYQRGRSIVIVVREGSPPVRGVERAQGSPYIHRPSAESLREMLARAAVWEAPDRRGGRRSIMPPLPVVRALRDRGTWCLPVLTAITEAPSLRPDGSVVDQPGYDTATGLLYEPGDVAFPPVPQHPTRAEVVRALDVLRDPFLEFEWARREEDLAVVLAAIITALVRPAIDGPVPAFVLRSTTRGSGKTLINLVIGAIATGRGLPINVLAREPDEQRKALLALALEGHALIGFDNLTGTIGSPVLAAAITSCEVRDRLLGASAMPTAPLRVTWLLNGNGLSFAHDLGRRVLVADLAPTVEHPEDRGGYRYPDLLAHVRTQRPALVTAALTLVRAHAAAGWPAHGRPVYGGFESWDRVVRGALLGAAVADPCACRDRLRMEDDDDASALRALLEAWSAAFGTRATTIAEAVEAAPQHADLRWALTAFDSHGSAERLDTRSIGHRVRRFRGRIAGGLVLERAGERSGVVAYRVVDASTGGSGGSGGSPPPRNVTRARARARSESGLDETPGSPGSPGSPTLPEPKRDEDRPWVCVACRGGAAWHTREGHLVCRRCHPPAPGAEVEP